MAKHTDIEWADSSWSPWRGCTKVSAGCKNCYAERRAKWVGEDFNIVTRSKTTFSDPLKWDEPKRIFVCSLSDFFHLDVPEHWRKEAMEIIYRTPRHTYLILTKRPELIGEMMLRDWWGVFPNVWLGVSVETQDQIDRIGYLYDITASVKFISAEPLLGPLDLSEHMGLIDWVITGGESDQSNPRPMNLDWVRSIRDQCQENGVAFFHKQHGGKAKVDGAWGGRELDGRTWDEVPELKKDNVKHRS